MVLDKETSILYRRYIPDGIRLRGNKKLLEQVGPVTSSNERIVVFSSYADAKKSGMPFNVDPDSLPYVEKEDEYATSFCDTP